MKRQDLTGMTFGYLTATEYVGQRKWKCVCKCGAVRNVSMDKLKSGHTQSCGCKRRGLASANRKEYSSWQHMKRRCKVDPAYQHIQICDRWINSFENFLSDMGKMPFDGASIDRIDNSKGYEPSNCRWASKLLQTINRTHNKNNTSGVRGVSWDASKGKWAAQISLGELRHMKRFETLEDAATYRKQMEQKLFASVEA